MTDNPMAEHPENVGRYGEAQQPSAQQPSPQQPSPQPSALQSAGPVQAGQQTNPYGMPAAHPYYSYTGQLPPLAAPETPAPQPPRRGSGGLIAGIAVLALLAGGTAGGLGAYLVTTNQAQQAVLSGPNALSAPPPVTHTRNAPPGSVEAVAQKLLPSVVELQVQTKDGSGGEGSGIVFGADGLILTNNHVVEGTEQGGTIVAKFHDGRTASAGVIGTDPTSDLAVVRATGVSGLRPAEFGRSTDLAVGEQVVAVGSPYELSGTVTSGIISALHRPTRAGGENGGQETVMDAIQTDAAINPGNSGGPLVNMDGQVIGINSAIYSPQNSGGNLGGEQSGSIGIGFAIPVDQARRIGKELVATGSAMQAKLDITVTDAAGTSGAQIVQVIAGGAASKAGLRAGSVVIRADDRQIDSRDALIALVHAHQPGDRVTLTLRDGETRTVTLTGEKVGGN